MLVTLDVAQLRAVVAAAVVDALESEPARPEPLPALLTQKTLAFELGCSDRQIWNLRQQGLPVVWLGESPRFELATVLAWLRARQAPGEPDETRAAAAE
jgi:hypothetical protein